MKNYNESFPVYWPEFDEIFLGFKTELIGLATLLSSENSSEYLQRISNYENFKSLITNKSYKKKINNLLKKDPIISVYPQTDILTDVFLTAQLAICCELLDGTKVPLNSLRHENIESTLQALLGRYKNKQKGDIALENLYLKLHSADALRTTQILKALGLFTVESKNITQLSLGVGSGRKDLSSVHLQPYINISSDSIIEFCVKKQHAKDVIIVDGDPQREELFKELNNNRTYPVIAINDDTSDSLLKIPNILKEKNLALRNTVIALRIDHRMIPDVREFLKLVSYSIDDISQLIVTIGSGFNLDDFRGRTEVIQNMFDFLKSSGLDPVILKLHGNGTLEEQRNNHAFSLKSITTFQILYCKLKKKLLLKKLK